MYMLKNIFNDIHNYTSRDDASSKGTSPYGRGQKVENLALLHLAIKENDINAIKDFMHSKEWVELETPDNRGRTPLHWAVAVGSNEVARLIVKSTPKSKINAYDQNWRTALHYAAMAGRNDIVKVLFIKGARINARDRQGMTTLHYAAQNSNPFLVHSLLARGAEKHIKDKNKQLPYNVAICWKSPPEIIHLLDPSSSLDIVKKKVALTNDEPYKDSYRDHYYSDTGVEITKPQKSSARKPPQVSKPAKLPMPFLGTSTQLDSIMPRRQPPPTPKELSMECVVKLEMEKEVNKVQSMVMKNIHAGNSGRLKQMETKEESHKHQMAMNALLMRHRRRKEEETMKEKRERHGLKVMDSQQYKTVFKTHPDFGYHGNGLSALTTTTTQGSKGGGGGVLSLYNYWKNVGKSIEGLQHSLSKKYISLPSSPKRGGNSREFYGSRECQPSPPPLNFGKLYGTRDRQPSPPRRGNSRGFFSLRDRRKKVVKVQYTYPFLRDPIRIPVPSRLALMEFVGTSDRKNYLNEKRDAGLRIHQCVDKQKLRNQWL